ncbi:MAG: tRNA uridine-5-carboxymethylaminomethyl(34) synthesis GTPase MnmE [Chitinophagales bacterium]
MPQYLTTDLEDTIVALSTPQGVGAIGVVRLSGKNAVHICNVAFRGKNLLEQATHTIHFGTIRDDHDKIIDEVTVALFKEPHSYTKENVIEVSCHGSPYIIQKVIELFLSYGARLAKPGEFTLRAFMNGRFDLSQAEAVADLISSQSESAHQIALQQMRGGFSNQIEQLREQLVNFAALIELELDFGEEDVEFADRQQLVDLVTTIQQLIRRLRESFTLGNAIKNGVTTVIAGRPNAGKSTLLNAILNEERAIVSEIAGTTRDTIEEVVNIKGVQFRLIDTAGIRDAQDQIEAIGVRKTMETIQKSTILVYVFDVIDTSSKEVEGDLQKLQKEGLEIIAVANKMDLDPYTKPENYVSEIIDAEHIITTSALNKMNIEHLKDSLYDIVLAKKLNSETTIVSNVRHFEALQQSYAALDRVLEGIHSGITGELLAFDIREALHHLGEITGQVDVDRDILGAIFSKFCIGK